MGRAGQEKGGKNSLPSSGFQPSDHTQQRGKACQAVSTIKVGSLLLPVKNQTLL